MTIVFALSAVGPLLYALTGLVGVLRAIRHVPKLRDLGAPEPSRWPRVSLIVPARDEAIELEAAVASRLREGYPALEVIIVDDRSTDGTGAIADALAARDPRVIVEHVTTLPEGWLGKVHALHRGVARASGEWLLFSDADVHYAPGTLERAVAYLEHDGADQLSVVPEMRPRTLFVGAMQASFLRLATAFGRLPSVPDPGSSAAVGAGLFSLVRRSALARTPGLGWLRLEVIDDMALGQMLKSHGARPRVVHAVGDVWLDFYPSVREFVRGAEKNGFALMGGFRYTRLPVALVVFVGLELGAFVPLVSPGIPWSVRMAAAFAVGSTTAAGWLLNRWLSRARREVWLWPAAIVVLAFACVRSAWLAWRRGGIVWRDTRYSLASLRAGRRIRLL